MLASDYLIWRWMFVLTVVILLQARSIALRNRDRTVIFSWWKRPGAAKINIPTMFGNETWNRQHKGGLSGQLNIFSQMNISIGYYWRLKKLVNALCWLDFLGGGDNFWGSFVTSLLKARREIKWCLLTFLCTVCTDKLMPLKGHHFFWTSEDFS